MNPFASNQIALDNALVAPEARLKIVECNRRIEFTKPQIEATYQVTLDALKLRNIETLPELVVDHLHQPWRTFAAVINSCLSGKTTGLDNLRLSRAQILWGMYHCKNVDFVELLWEDFAFKINNHFSKGTTSYLRFTKININHFISQNKSISMRNRINLHTARDDSLLGTLKYVSKTEEHQVYEALIPKEMFNKYILNSTAYKTYYVYTSGAKEPKKARKFKKPASPKQKIVGTDN
ncbi:hypothetical protein Tco_0997056 [Tanacetum coccineum]